MGILVVLSPLRLTSGEGKGRHNAAVTALTEKEVLLWDGPGQSYGFDSIHLAAAAVLGTMAVLTGGK